MFHTISQGFGALFEKFRGKTRLSEDEVKRSVAMIEKNLLEADVALSVVKKMTEAVRAQSLQQPMVKGFTAEQLLMRNVYEVLQTHLGDAQPLLLKGRPAVVLVVGTQGSGKTTMSTKTAHALLAEGKRVSLASVDVYRPAAREQLAILAQKIGVPCLPIDDESNPLVLAKKALTFAKSSDVLIVDTAGRFDVDERLMHELSDLATLLKPSEILFVGDALAGQSLLQTAQAFQKRLALTGIAFSRVDGDSRAGALLSVRAGLNLPIKCLGTGELPEDYERLKGAQMASRILGMGDLETLSQNMSTVMSERDAEDSMARMQSGKFHFGDLLTQLETMEKMSQKMGGLQKMMGFIPGMGNMQKALESMPNQGQILKRKKAMIQAMTEKERNGLVAWTNARKMRVSKGSGNSLNDVNELIKQFETMRAMFAKFGNNPQALMAAMGKMQR